MLTGLMPLIRWSSREVLSTLVLITVDDFHKLRGSGVLRRTPQWTKSVKNSSQCSHCKDSARANDCDMQPYTSLTHSLIYLHAMLGRNSWRYVKLALQPSLRDISSWKDEEWVSPNGMTRKWAYVRTTAFVSQNNILWTFHSITTI